MMGGNKLARALMVLIVAALVASAIGLAEEKQAGPQPQYIMSFESKADLATLGNDGSKAKFALDTKTFCEGKASLKVTPSRSASKTIVTMPLAGADKLKLWVAAKSLAISVFIPKGMKPLINDFFVALYDVTVDRLLIETVGVDKINTKLPVKENAWNTIFFDVTSSYLKEGIVPENKYALYFSFLATENGKSLPLKNAFYLDGAYLLMPPPPAAASDYIWTFDTAEEVVKCNNDNSGTSFALSNEHVLQGDNAVKVTPDGNHIESKMALDVPASAVASWNGHKELIAYVYVPEGCTLDNYFLGMGDLNNGWAWVDGFLAPYKGHQGWNVVHYPLTKPMQTVKPNGKYALYWIFWGTDASGAKVNLTAPFFVDCIKFAPIDYLFEMESAEEIAKYSPDNSGTTFALESEIVFQGKGSVKITPDGNHNESKMALDLSPELMGKWNGHPELVANVYVPEDSTLSNFFVGMGDLNNGWAWVDGFLAPHEVEKGWNEVHYPLTKLMLNLKGNGKYALYMIFWGTDATGAKVNLTTPFYVDGIYVAPAVDYLWTMDTEDEMSKFGPDNSGTSFALDASIVYQGKNSVKVTPDGNHIESKVAIDLNGDRLAKYANCNELVMNVYVPEDCTLDNYFLGMGDLNNGWAWVDGFLAPYKGQKGWNEVHYPLTDLMKKVVVGGKYALYLIFWGTDASGAKVNLTAPFYLDGIYMR